MLGLIFCLLGLLVTNGLELSLQCVIIFVSMILLIISLQNSYFGMLSWVFGMDLLSLMMIMMSYWIILLMLVAMDNSTYFKLYSMICVSLLFILIIAFSVYDFLLFYVYFESALIPVFILILGWGYQPERLNAGLYMLMYTLFASLPLFLSLLSLYWMEMTTIYFLLESYDVNCFWGMALLFAFLVKLPIYMMHLWLPRAHVEAPVGGSMILAGVLLKLGAYGLLRVNMLIKFFMVSYGPYLISLGLIGSVVMGLVCVVQYDVSMLVAFSSVVHMSLVFIGMIVGTEMGVIGALMIMLSHGLVSSCLFCLVNIMYIRLHSRSIILVSGGLVLVPMFSLCMFLLCACNMSAPPSFGLLGEILILVSSMNYNLLMLIPLSIVNFLCAIFSLYLYNLCNHGGIYNMTFFHPMNLKELSCVLFHWFPLNFMFINFCLFANWV